MIGVAIAVLALLIWLVIALIGSGNGGEEVAMQNTPESVSQASVQGDLETTATNEGDQPDEGAGGVQPVSDTSGAQTNLPVSRNARTDLGIGVRVQVVPGLRVALRSEPSAERGETIGEMTEDDVATIVAGPEYTQGDTDTIVWWFVTLENGTQAWAAANTSQQTLLMPTQ
jgi:hypothetical protein